MFVLKMLSFFWALSLGPKEGRICAATSDFVATSIVPPATGTNGDKCALLLMEHRANEAQPRQGVAVGVFGASPPPPPSSRGQNV